MYTIKKNTTNLQLMNRIFVIGIIFLSFVFGGCNKSDAPDWIKKAGETTVEHRETGTFNAIETGEKFDLVLFQDTSQPEFVEISYGKNLISGIETKVENGTLYFKDNNHFNWVRKLNLRVKVLVNIHNIDKLNIKDASTVICSDTLRIKRLNYTISSVSDATLLLDCAFMDGSLSNSSKTTLRGRCNLLALSIDDASSIDANNTNIGDCYLFYFSPTDSYIDAKYILGVEIYGRGNVYYKSDPIISLKKVETGSGRLIKD